MCLSIPGKVTKIENGFAYVNIGGIEYRSGLHLLDEDVQLGDYVLIHAGFIIKKVNAKEAEETLAMINEVKNEIH